MATRTITTKDDSLITALGGTVNAGDDVYVNKYSINHSPADLSAADLNSLVLADGYGGEMSAAAGAQLKAVVNNSGAGIFKFESASRKIELISTSSSGVIKSIYCRPSQNGQLVVNTCAVTTLMQLLGQLFVESGCDLATALIEGGQALFRNASYALIALTVGNNATCEVQRDLADCAIKGTGTLVFSHSAVSPSGTVTLDGGTLQIVECGTITSLVGTTGTLDLRQVRAPFTITTRQLDPGVVILTRRTNSVPITITTNSDRYGGPRVITMD